MNKISVKSISFFGLVILLFPGIFQVLPQQKYLLGLVVLAGIYALITIGLSLFMGYTGQISLGHAAFFGVGAYSSAVLTNHFSVNAWIAMVCGIIFNVVLAIFVGKPSLKLKGHYLAMATLALGIIAFIVFTQEVALTGGPDGMDVDALTFFGMKLRGDLTFYYVVWGTVFCVFVFCVNIIQSRIGRAIRAIHTSETAARSMGIDTAYHKVYIFAFSAALASIAGSLYVHYTEFVNPASFSVMFSVELIIMIVMGGIHSIWGALIGAVLVTFLSHELLHAFDEYEILVFGVVLLALTIFLPDGLISLGDRFKKRPKTAQA